RHQHERISGLRSLNCALPAANLLLLRVAEMTASDALRAELQARENHAIGSILRTIAEHPLGAAAQALQGHDGAVVNPASDESGCRTAGLGRFQFRPPRRRLLSLP